MKYRAKPHAATGARKLARRFRKNQTLKGLRLVSGSGQEKMSTVLLEFIEPFKRAARTKQAYEKLIGLAVLAWNATLLEEAKKQNLINESKQAILDMAGEEWSQDLDQILKLLMERKQRDFADNNRFIIDYELSETENDYHLSVISTEQKAT